MPSNSRQWRLDARNGTLSPTGDVAGDAVKGNLAFGIPSGTYDMIEVSSDGGVHISPEACADDVVAFVHGAIATNPHIADGIKKHLRDFLDAMDERAVQRHGYAAYPEEAAVAWPKAE